MENYIEEPINFEGNQEDPDPEENPELKQLIDSAGLILQAGILSKTEGRHILDQTRSRAAELFPDQIEYFKNNYEVHLSRLIDEYCVPDIGNPAVN